LISAHHAFNPEIIYPRHIIQATGFTGEPKIPEFTDIEKFKGTLVHSSAFRSAKGSKGKKVIIIGANNSGQDIAEDYVLHGADVTIVQRSSTCILTREMARMLLSLGYREDGVSFQSPISLIIITPNS
jgi:cation diffusion facilitator CzcD-associated flavoprotein CzcO